MTKNNKNRPGYKNTKIGWIPQEWECVKLEELGSFSKGKGITKKELVANGIPCIRYGEIYTVHHYSVKKYYSYIDNNTASISKKLKRNDILLAGSGETREEIGKAVAFLDDKEVYAGGDIIILSPKNGNSLLLSYILNNDIINKQKFKLGQGNSVVHIYSYHLRNLLIPLPPLPEQKKIAEILSTWDKAIANYESLISNYKLRKKALMQRLLTGKVRFREFEGQQWKEVRLGEVCRTFSGGTPSRDHKEFYSGNINWIKSGELNSDYILETDESITDLGFKKSSAKIVEKNSILLALYGATAGVIGITKIRAAINQAILAILPTDEIFKYYLYHLLKSIMPKVVRNMVQGGQPNLNGAIIKSLKISIPLKLPEQRRIASVLSAQDRQIELLKKQKEELEMQKKGLMQVLLTGEVRVKINRGNYG